MSFSLHIDKVDLNDVFRITDIDGRGPFGQEITRQSVLGRDGSYRIYRRIPERLLNVEGRILAKSKEDLRDKINYLNTILYTNDAVPIVFSDEPNVTYYGEYAGDPAWEEKFVRGRGTLPFVCYDPYKYGKEEAVSVGSSSIDIDSPQGTPPIFEIEFTGNTSQFEIQHKQTGRYLKVTYDFYNGDKLILDAANRRVTINGITRMQTLTLDSDWFNLVHGSNSFDISSRANAKLKYRERRL